MKTPLEMLGFQKMEAETWELHQKTSMTDENVNLNIWFMKEITCVVFDAVDVTGAEPHPHFAVTPETYLAVGDRMKELGFFDNLKD